MNGPLRCGKGTTWEGGQRVPSIARWPGTVAAGSHARQMTSSMDFFATALELALSHDGDDGLGGHIVQGHVDGLAMVVDVGGAPEDPYSVRPH